MKETRLDKPARTTSEWIKLHLDTNYKVANWKRLSKKKTPSGDIVRLFQAPDGTTVEVTESPTFIFLKALPSQDMSAATIEARLIEAAKAIRHCGDYGNMLYNHSKRHVWWVGGDADFEVSAGHTDFDEVKKLLRVPGVSKVTIGDEAFPDESSAWKDLGEHGIICDD